MYAPARSGAGVAPDRSGRNREADRSYRDEDDQDSKCKPQGDAVEEGTAREEQDSAHDRESTDEHLKRHESSNARDPARRSRRAESPPTDDRDGTARNHENYKGCYRPDGNEQPGKVTFQC